MYYPIILKKYLSTKHTVRNKLITRLSVPSLSLEMVIPARINNPSRSPRWLFVHLDARCTFVPHKPDQKRLVTITKITPRASVSDLTEHIFHRELQHSRFRVYLQLHIVIQRQTVHDDMARIALELAGIEPLVGTGINSTDLVDRKAHE